MKRGNIIQAKTRIKDINIFFKFLLTLYKNTNAKTVCMAQAGDFVGGESCSVFSKGLARKAMNSLYVRQRESFNF